MVKILVFEARLSVCSYSCSLWSDNLAAKSIAENPVFHACTKHLKIDIHFVREKVENGEVEICYVPTDYQIADIFTKGLARSRFQFLCDKLHLRISPVKKPDLLGISLKPTVKE